MQIRFSTTIPLLLATMLLVPIQGIGHSASVAPGSAATHLGRLHLAQLEAPIGHRQPTLDDLPPWLRNEEKPGAEADPGAVPQTGNADADQRDQRRGQRHAPRARPDDGVPRICDPC